MDIIGILKNTTSTILPFLSNPANLPPIIVMIIIALLLFILLRVGVFALGSLLDVLKDYTFPILVFGLAYLMAIGYYLPIYVKQTFTYEVYNETLNKTVTVYNETIYKDLSSKENFILIPLFYDKLLYYQAKYNRPIDEVIVVFAILLLIMIYINKALWKAVGPWSIILTFLIMFIITLGFKGTILAVAKYTVLQVMMLLFIAGHLFATAVYIMKEQTSK